MRRSVALAARSLRPTPPPLTTRTPPKPTPLWRFVLIATIVVVAIGSIAFARRGGPPDLRITGKVSGTPTPTAQLPDDAAATVRRTAFAASGSWTMSSLPSCFRERERSRGSVTELRAKLPPASERVRPPSVVVSGDCTIAVREHELWISRGDDRLQVPAEAALYRDAGGLTLVYIHGTRAEIRRYERASAQSFAR